MAVQLEELVARLRLDSSGVDRGLSSVNGALDRAGGAASRTGNRLSFGVTAPLLGIAAAGVSLAASFDKTMRQVEIATGGPSEALKKLAIRMGAETAFSAGEAADAMLELAKGGMTAAQIQGGVLAETMKLATVGEVDLATASTYTSTAMNQFGLKAKDASSITVALAGAANAGSASVDSLAQGLGNVGGVAKNMGLSLQETTGILSLLDSAGIKGAEGGTALRSMLNGLTPTSIKAKEAVKEFGLSFTDANGQFRPMADIAENLKDKLGGLSEAQRAATLETIFGTYGQQAATQLMNGGRAAVEKYTKASFDQATTTKLANAAMEGTSGAIERAKGSIETAALMIGDVLAPYVEKAAGFIELLANKFSALPSSMQALIVGIGALLAIVGPLLIGFGFLASAVAAIGLPVIVVVAALAALGAALVIAYQRSAEFRAIVQTAMQSAASFIMTSVVPAALAIRDAFENAVARVTPIVMQIVGVIQQHMPAIRETVNEVFTSVRSIVIDVMNGVKGTIDRVTGIVTTLWDVFGGTILATIDRVFPAMLQIIRGAMQLIRGVVKTISSLIQGDWRGVWEGIKDILRGALNILGDIIRGAVGLLRGAMGLVKDAVVTVVVEMATRIASKFREGVDTLVRIGESIKGRILGALSGAAGWLVDIGRQIIAGLVNGIKSAYGAVVSAVQGLIDKIPGPLRKAMGIASPSKVTHEIGEQIGEGLAQGMEAKQQRAKEAAEKLIDAFREQLDKRADAVRQRVEQLADSITSAFASTGSLLNVEGQRDAEGNELPLTSADVLAAKAAAAARAAEFAQVLAQLKAAGLSQPQLAELAAAGPEALEVAQATLEGGGKAIKALNELQAQIDKSGKQAAKTATIEMSKAGVAVVEGLLDGLDKKKGAVYDRMREIAERMIKSLKRELGIASPSKRFAELGEQTGQGFVIGLDGMVRRVAAAGQRMADAAVQTSSMQMPDLAFSRLQQSARAGVAAASAAQPLNVRVFIGDRELTDIVRVEVVDTFSPVTTAIRQGAL